MNFLIHPTKFSVLTRYPRPPQVALVQTDGSFSRGGLSRTAVHLCTTKGENYTLCTSYYNHVNHIESEWNSVLDGIQFSKKKGQSAIELENDNQSIMNMLVRRANKKSLYLDYYYAIHKEVRDLEYMGLRWIPREFNKADKIFRLSDKEYPRES